MLETVDMGGRYDRLYENQVGIRIWWTMSKMIVKSSIDFGKIEADLGKLEPPKISKEDAVLKILPAIRKQIEAGVSIDQIKSVLDQNGLKLAKKTLTGLVENGNLGKGGARPMMKPEFDAGRAENDLNENTGSNQTPE